MFDTTMCASGDQFEIKTGQRVEYQGYYGTVRFVGELAQLSGTWVGVEWDDPTRGKHDGSHNGISYFKTQHPFSGSFVRPVKLNLGISCVEAIHKRYGKVEGPMAGVDKTVLAELKREFNIPFIEMVGFDKVNSQQSQFVNLNVVQLAGEPVNGPGEEQQLSSLCPSVTELNLSKSLLSSWKSVCEIAGQLKNLALLDVSDNKLPLPSENNLEEFSKAFLSLSHIVINNLEYGWEEVLAQNNQIHKLSSPPSNVLSNLTSLYLQNNPIREWDNVNKIGNLHSLQLLHLGNTGVKKIFFPGEVHTSLFSSLKVLFLPDNEINDWQSINELNKLVSLESLQLRLNPIMEEPKAYDLIVARIKNVQTLNCTTISLQERKGAEFDYMKHYGREWLVAVNDPVLLREFYSQHPRFPELIDCHGTLTKDDFITIPSTLNSRLITIKIFCPNRPDVKELQKRVPKNMTVQKLSGLVQKLLNTGGATPSLRAISAKAPDVDVLLEKDMQELSYYSIEDGDSIAVRW
ncbi:Tubulin-specific chaperone E [Frankliniella fusca]|uniref:Tubulin-specific chaperone E n=1 Tax=Frankliniella fusca TaxID=407009 RepID=A0AAE1HQ07_9NEOP|nr:Tubulin-specific chaperone E [Frankliniella fusca]